MTTPSETLTADEANGLLRRQAALQGEASQAIANLALLERLAPLGEPWLWGSYATGLMVWRDLDIIINTPSLSPARAFDALRPLLAHLRIAEARYLNQSSAFNETGNPADERLFFMLKYQPPQRDAAAALPEQWKIDISLWTAPEPRVETLPPTLITAQLTDETRLAILWIKDVWFRLPSYRESVYCTDVYDAVLVHGVRTPAEFDAYLMARGKPSRMD